MRNSSSKLSPQLLILCVAGLFWALRPYPSLAALAAAYLLAWGVLNYFGGMHLQRSRSVPTAWLWGGAVLALAGPLVALYRGIDDLGWEDGLRGLPQNLEHRLALEEQPALHPSVVFLDHPQVFYLKAPKAQAAGLSLGPGVEPLSGTALGEGLFRIEYDPKTDGAPETDEASIEARLRVDDRSHRRTLRLVRWQSHPRWFASAPELGLVATPSEETDELIIVRRDGEARRIPVGDGPTDAAFLDDHRIAVSHRYGSDLWVLDALTGEILTKIELGYFQTRLAVSPEKERLAVALAGESSGLELLSLPDLTREGSVELSEKPDWLAFGPEKGTLIYSVRSSRALFKIEEVVSGEDPPGESPSRFTPPSPLLLGRPAITLAAGPKGERLYVAVTDYRPDGKPHRGNHFIQDQILTVDVDSWEVRDRWLTARRTPAQTQAGNLDSGLGPMGIAPRGDGSVGIAFSGSDEVWWLPPGGQGSPQVTAGGDLDLAAPHHVGDLGDGHWAVSSPGGGALAVYSPEGELLHFVPVSPSDAELDSRPEGSLYRQDLSLRAGELAFYEGTRAGISCQSCHLHGGSDESPHDIGQTPLLPTLTVGGISGTSPYLRDGSFPRVRDLNDHLAQTLYRGYARWSPRRRLDLESYVESLPVAVNPRRLQGVDLEAMERGVRAFVAARCDLCHSFPAFTNLSQHPVRSLFPIYGADLPPEALVDTPSLLGSHGRSHFLQDGRAHSLSQVLDEFNPANRHGDTQALGAEERADLIYLLESL